VLLRDEDERGAGCPEIGTVGPGGTVKGRTVEDARAILGEAIPRAPRCCSRTNTRRAA